MQRETSNDTFLDYGSVYHQPIDREHPELIHQTMVAITRRYVSQFYCFNCDTYLQVKSGIGVLLVSHTAEAADVQEFAMNRLIHIKPNIYFAVVSTTQKLEYDLYAESSYLLHITDFPSQYEFLAVLPRIEIQKILGYYYRIRTENYCFHGERHDFFELTYVDTGELEINNYFVDQVFRDVTQDLAEELNISLDEAETRVYSSGYKIYTPMDP